MFQADAVEGLDRCAVTGLECNVHAVARRRRLSVDGCLDAENDVGRAILDRRSILREDAHAEHGHHRVVQSGERAMSLLPIET